MASKPPLYNCRTQESFTEWRARDLYSRTETLRLKGYPGALPACIASFIEGGSPRP